MDCRLKSPRRRVWDCVAYARRMDTRRAVERLYFSPDEPAGVPTHVSYDDRYLGYIIGSGLGWTATVSGINLGQFQTRAEARAAIVAWVSGLDIVEWPAPRS
jgi:hypothetical protein